MIYEIKLKSLYNELVYISGSSNIRSYMESHKDTRLYLKLSNSKFTSSKLTNLHIIDYRLLCFNCDIGLLFFISRIFLKNKDNYDR